ncbi:hypothetical protein RDWZM_001722 [Blomia tropicalis]|uniref:Uncharacterized protein n=1 Tax=Blomia tropicalis TaxID=40697 RepID=A0A9Q0MCP2_BLOTA|nr:hypothetical protein RDWZM_001722 [Blomia tropicalis]
MHGDYLVYSTRTDINRISLNGKTFKGEHSIEKILRTSSYLINTFSVSFKDNIVLYGIDTIYAAPLGAGENLLNLRSHQLLNIPFVKHFTVDWVDYNVYAFKDRALRIYSLRNSLYNRIIHEGSNDVRNIVVEHNQHFIAWIANGNNLVRAGKDGSKVSNVFTSNTKIHCMSIDPSTNRFFYYVQTKIRSRITEKNNDDSKKTDKKDEIVKKKFLFVPYCIRSIMPVNINQYHDSTFVIIQDVIESGDTVYTLKEPSRNGTAVSILKRNNWMITSLQIAQKIVVKQNLCSYPLQSCPNLCVHVTDTDAMCICMERSSCNSYMMTTLPGSNFMATTRAPSISQQVYPKNDNSITKYLMFGSGILLGCFAVFLLYTQMFTSNDEDMSSIMSKSKITKSQFNLNNDQTEDEGIFTKFKNMVANFLGFNSNVDETDGNETDSPKNDSESVNLESINPSMGTISKTNTIKEKSVSISQRMEISAKRKLKYQELNKLLNSKENSRPSRSKNPGMNDDSISNTLSKTKVRNAKKNKKKRKSSSKKRRLATKSKTSNDTKPDSSPAESSAYSSTMNREPRWYDPFECLSRSSKKKSSNNAASNEPIFSSH